MKKIFSFLTISRLSKFSLYALICSIPFSIAAVEIFFGFSIFFYALDRLIRKDASFSKNLPVGCVFVFAFCLFLSIFVSGPYLAKSAGSFFSKWLEYLLIFFMVQDIVRTREDRRRVIRLFFITAVITAADAIFQRISGFDLFRFYPLIPVIQTYPGQPPIEFQAVTAAFDHSNPLGNYLMACGLLALGWIEHSQPNQNAGKILRDWSGGVLIIAALILASSRGSWIAFVAGLLIYGLVSGSLKRFIVTGFLLLAAASIPAIQARLTFTVSSPHGDSERTELWSLAERIIRESPWFGKGVGTFMDYASSYSNGEFARYAHNGYLQIWAESGIFAMAAFLIFSIILIFTALAALRRQPDERGIIAGLIACWTGLLIHNFFDVHLYGLRTAVLFWAVAGLLASLTNKTSHVQTLKASHAN